jgi:hypothetical protein
MRKNKIRSYKEVATTIAEYYARPKEFYIKFIEPKGANAVAAS